MKPNDIVFCDSFEEADQHNLAYYDGLTPDEKLQAALELMATLYEAHPRLERIYRTVDIGECPVSVDRWMGL